MTDLLTLPEKTSDAEAVRELIGCTTQRLIELDVENLTGAAHSVRDPDRVNHHNGHRDRVVARTMTKSIISTPAGVLGTTDFAPGAR